MRHSEFSMLKAEVPGDAPLGSPGTGLEQRARQLQAELAGFTGTETYTRHACGASEDSTSGGQVLLTEGAEHLAERAGCYWLMDLIASTLALYRWDTFVSVHWERKGGGGTVALTNGNGLKYYHQDIPSSDFPLEHFTLYAALDGLLGAYVVMLPSEY